MRCELCAQTVNVRTTRQNSRMWKLLDLVAAQVDWYGQKLESEDWKDMFTASLKKCKVVPNLDGDGFVAIGLHTKKMTKQQNSDLQDLIEAFAAERNIFLEEPHGL